MTEHIQVGAWIDGPQPGKTDEALAQWAQAITACGITRPCIVTNVGIKPLNRSRWAVSHLRRAIAALRLAGADEVGVMIWPVAQAQAVDDTIEDMGRLYGWRDLDKPARQLVPDFISIDAEGNSNASGWGPAGATLAGDLTEGLAEAQAGHDGCYLSCTAVPFRKGPRLQDAALLARPEVRVGEPQAYSQYQADKAWTHSPFFRPGVIQTNTWQTWSPMLEDGHLDALVFGMAIYAQDHPTGVTGVDALWLAAQTSIDLGVRRFSYWSWKHIKGNTKERLQRQDFLRELAKIKCPEPGPEPEPGPDAEYTFADALDRLMWGDGFTSMWRAGTTLRKLDTEADDWKLTKATDCG